MSCALDLFKVAHRGPFTGLVEQHALTIIGQICSGGLITEDDPQYAGMWSAVAVIWASDWRAMAADVARETEARETEQRMNARIAQMLSAMRAGTIEVIKQLGAQIDGNRVELGAHPALVDGIARAVAGRVTLPHIDTTDIARQFAAQVQPVMQTEVHQHYDIADSLKHAARESFSWVWALVAAVVCAASMGFGVHEYVSSADAIAELRADNAALQQQVAAVRAPAHSKHQRGKP